MQKRKRGVQSGVCGLIEIIRKSKVGRPSNRTNYYIKKTVCGSIRIMGPRGISRTLELLFSGSNNRRIDVKDLYEYILRFFEERDDYEIGWKEEHKRRFEPR